MRSREMHDILARTYFSHWSNAPTLRVFEFFFRFLAIGGCQANVPAVLAYQANNVLSHSKRSVASAVSIVFPKPFYLSQHNMQIVIGMGGVGGIFASLAYRA